MECADNAGVLVITSYASTPALKSPHAAITASCGRYFCISPCNQRDQPAWLRAASAPWNRDRSESASRTIEPFSSAAVDIGTPFVIDFFSQSISLRRSGEWTGRKAILRESDYCVITRLHDGGSAEWRTTLHLRLLTRQCRAPLGARHCAFTPL